MLNNILITYRLNPEEENDSLYSTWDFRERLRVSQFRYYKVDSLFMSTQLIRKLIRQNKNRKLRMRCNLLTKYNLRDGKNSRTKAFKN